MTPEQRDKRNAQSRASHKANRSRNLAKQAEWRDKNRDYFLKKTYGLTWANYEELLRSQGGCCAICGSPTPGKGRKRFDVDHDHRCCPGGKSCGKCIRGLLCLGCNAGIGNLKDNSILLRRAAIYIDQHIMKERAS